MSTKRGLDFVKSAFKFMTNGTGFNRTLKNISITSGGDGKCLAEFKVQPEDLNSGGGLHGGFTATAIDILTTCALITKGELPLGVTVDLHVNYLKGAKEGDLVIVTSNTVKVGKSLAFLECKLQQASDDSIIAIGTHTKYIGDPMKPFIFKS